MLNSSRLVLLAASASASQDRSGSLNASKKGEREEEQSDPDNKHETAIPKAAAAVEEEKDATSDADGAVEGAYDLEDIDAVLAELEGEGVDDSDSSDIVLTDSSAPSFAPEEHWEDVTKEVCVDEELARLEGRHFEETGPPRGWKRCGQRFLET